jgi:hypothetical protein
MVSREVRECFAFHYPDVHLINSYFFLLALGIENQGNNLSLLKSPEAEFQ